MPKSGILNIYPAFLSDEGPRTLADLEENGEPRPDQKALIHYNDHKLAFFDPISCKELETTKYDLITQWKEASYEPKHFDHIRVDLDTLTVRGSFPMPEQKLFLILTNTYIHAISMRYRKRVIQKYIWSEISAYAAMPLNELCKN